MKWLRLPLLMIVFAQSINVSAAPRSTGRGGCEQNLLGSAAPKYKFGKLRTIESLDFGDDGRVNSQGVKKVLLELYANALVKGKMLPASSELSKWLVKNVTLGKKTRDDFVEEFGAEAGKVIPQNIWDAIADPQKIVGDPWFFKDLNELVAQIAAGYPEIYQNFKIGVQKQALLFFRHRMRPPSLRELGAQLKFEDLDLLSAVIARPGFWDEAVFSDLGRNLEYTRKRIKNAYARAVRGTDTPAAHRTRRIEPTLRRVVEAMIITKSNEHYQWRALWGDYGRYQLKTGGRINLVEREKMLANLELELSAMLGLTTLKRKPKDSQDRWVFDMPVLFEGGLDSLHALARAENQPTFTSFEDKRRFPQEYAGLVRSKIVEAPGVIISTIVPGLKVDWMLLEGMIKMSKHKKYPLILIPADGSLQDLDEKVLNHPEINILTAQIENDEIMFSTFPSNGRGDPLGQFKNKKNMFKIGQQIILPHHILAHEAVATAHNSQNQTQLFSTGTVNLPEIGSVGKFQKARAYKMAREMKRSFLVVEKIDVGIANDFGGATNHWHIRPVEYREGEKGEPGVFVDNGSAYLMSHDADGKIEVKKERASAVQIYFPDVHFVAANPEVLKSIKDYMDYMIAKNVQVTLVMPDPIDSRAINHHVEKKQKDRRALSKLLQANELSFEDEINDAIAEVNVLLQEFPGVNIIFQYSNHSDEWIEKDLINDPSWLQQIVNGDLINEINFACGLNKWSPLEYLLLYRQSFLAKATLDGSDKYKDKAVFISDPSRVRVMRPGEPLSTSKGDEWTVYSQHHGHSGANGGKSSFKTHGLGEERAIYGDAHRMAFYGVGNQMTVHVGSTSFSQPYTKLGYSSWGVGMAVISPYNTIQLVQWDPYTKSFYQREKLGILQGERFFGDDPLRIVGAMDDDELRKQRDTEQFNKWFDGQIEWINSGALKAPSFAPDEPAD